VSRLFNGLVQPIEEVIGSKGAEVAAQVLAVQEFLASVDAPTLLDYLLRIVPASQVRLMRWLVEKQTINILDSGDKWVSASLLDQTSKNLPPNDPL
jgi:hypothetical protein